MCADLEAVNDSAPTGNQAPSGVPNPRKDPDYTDAVQEYAKSMHDWLKQREAASAQGADGQTEGSKIPGSGDKTSPRDIASLLSPRMLR